MKNALIILQLIPALISIITSLENAIPMSGQGKVKLDMLKNFVSVSSDTLAEIWPAVEKIVEVFVNGMNAVGVFKSSTPAATPAA